MVVLDVCSISKGVISWHLWCLYIYVYIYVFNLIPKRLYINMEHEQEKQKQGISETTQQWDYHDMTQQEWVSLNAVICKGNPWPKMILPNSACCSPGHPQVIDREWLARGCASAYGINMTASNLLAMYAVLRSACCFSLCLRQNHQHPKSLDQGFSQNTTRKRR